MTNTELEIMLDAATQVSGNGNGDGAGGRQLTETKEGTI